MILILSMCKEPLHEEEFVRPIERILSEKGVSFFTRSYLKLKESDLKNAKKVIISGTSLKDGEYLYPKNFEKLSWIKNFEKPILGICAGAQVLAVFQGQKIFACTEIGSTPVVFRKEFFGCNGKIEVYSLHQMCFTSSRDKFIEFGRSKSCIHAMKVINKPFYGVLFHPEVKNHEIILNFCRI